MVTKRYVRSQEALETLRSFGFELKEELLNGTVVYTFETTHSNRYIRRTFNVKTGGYDKAGT